MGRNPRLARFHATAIAVAICAGGCGARTAAEDGEEGEPVPTARVWGTVFLYSADDPGCCGRPTVEGATVVAFEPITLRTDLFAGPELFPDPRASADGVAELEIGPDGLFELRLPDGDYSLLVEYRGQWFPWQYDAGTPMGGTRRGWWNPLVLEPGDDVREDLPVAVWRL